MRAGVQEEREQDEEMARGGAQQAGTFTLVLVTARQPRLECWIYFITGLTASHLIFSRRGDILSTDQRE